MDDYFVAFCISLPSIYPAPPHNATSAINASYDKVIIGKIPFLNYGTITIYVDWACTPRLERTVLPFLVASYEVLYHITTIHVKIFQNKRINNPSETTQMYVIREDTEDTDEAFV